MHTFVEQIQYLFYRVHDKSRSTYIFPLFCTDARATNIYLEETTGFKHISCAIVDFPSIIFSYSQIAAQPKKSSNDTAEGGCAMAPIRVIADEHYRSYETRPHRDRECK